MKLDEQQAVTCYTQAAAQGHTKSQFKLGFAYEHGRGVSRDLTKAAEFYQKAAESGHVESQFNLANLYLLDDDGVRIDSAKAALWLNKIAESGDARAQFMLGQLYETGAGSHRMSSKQQNCIARRPSRMSLVLSWLWQLV